MLTLLRLLTRLLLVALLASCGRHPEPTPEGKLGGDPKGMAIDALTEVKAVPASDADIVNGIILSKLEMGLRVCPETSGWIAEFSEHEAD